MQHSLHQVVGIQAEVPDILYGKGDLSLSWASASFLLTYTVLAWPCFVAAGHSKGAVSGCSSHVREDSSDCAMGGSYQSVHAWTQASLHGDYVLGNCSK